MTDDIRLSMLIALYDRFTHEGHTLPPFHVAGWSW